MGNGETRRLRRASEDAPAAIRRRPLAPRSRCHFHAIAIVTPRGDDDLHRAVAGASIRIADCKREAARDAQRRRRSPSRRCASRLIASGPGGYPPPSMKPPGTYKLTHRRRGEVGATLDPISLGFGRCQRIVDSLRFQILHGGPEQSLRIRQIFSSPREIYRVEISEPELRCSRTTLLDRDALEDLLETDGVRERVLAQYAD